MRTVSQVAVVDEQKCSPCAICMKICPVEAIRLNKQPGKRTAVIEENKCLGCTICMTRCPTQAIRMVERISPLQIGSGEPEVSEKEVAEICLAAHMYPDQVVCYCHRVQAKEVAAALLRGAKTPEEIAKATGARTGCGVLCITGIIRLLKAGGRELTEAPGYQWYDIDVSIWDIPPAIQQKYPEYYLAEDLRDINRLFPGGKRQ